MSSCCLCVRVLCCGLCLCLFVCFVWWYCCLCVVLGFVLNKNTHNTQTNTRTSYTGAFPSGPGMCWVSDQRFFCFLAGGPLGTAAAAAVLGASGGASVADAAASKKSCSLAGTTDPLADVSTRARRQRWDLASPSLRGRHKDCTTTRTACTLRLHACFKSKALNSAPCALKQCTWKSNPKAESTPTTYV